MSNQAAEVIAELMAKYNESRCAAERAMGSDFNESEFNSWFTAQVTGGAA